MDPISNADRLLLLLRQKLLDRSKAAASGRAARPAAQRPSNAGLGSVQALAGIEGVDERQLRRALIQALLADQLGEGLINEAEFQQVVERVTSAIGEDRVAASLLGRVIEDLRRPHR